MPQFFRSPVTWLVALVVVLAGAGISWQIGQQQKREQVERERIADVQAEQRRAAELEARRNLEQQRLKEEMLATKDAEDTTRQMDIEFRQAELQRKQFTADDRPVAETGYAARVSDGVRYADELRRREGEYRQQYEDEATRQRAQAEVDRQKRYLDQREREEQMARARREYAARESAPNPAATPAEPEQPPPLFRRPSSSPQK